MSPAGRAAALRTMATGQLDLLIIGGGITGCGVAREAARRGLATALIEMEDFAYGTSSRSSKLIHGGIRYLPRGEVRLVQEAAQERCALRQIAPHLTHPIPFIYPADNRTALAGLRAVFWLFDRLAAAGPEDAHVILSAAEVREAVPGLRAPLHGGVRYGEYATDDARLTLENALDAAGQGALIANHAQARALLQERGRITGALVQDRLSGETCTVRARQVVNATGPWAAETLRLGGAAAPARLQPSKGIHLLFAAHRLPITGAVVLRAPGRGTAFAVRRWDWVYVGTTDTAHHGPLDNPQPEERDIDFLLRIVQGCFPDREIARADVLQAWAGLRPLLAQPGRSPRDTSRHDALWQGPPGLISITGGKLTIYRRMAARVVDLVTGDQRPASLASLPGAPAPGAAATDPAAALRQAGVPARAAERIAWLYGRRAAALLDLEDHWRQPLAPDVPALRGEVRLAVEQEMALTLADCLDRRLGLRLFSADGGAAAAPAAAQIMGQLLGWSAAEQARQLQAYNT